ncbi:UNVERIFIED_CONTAM: Myb family transcription factor EFM [Sesamum radiatum]|uniref:Myb family transcription factor EFM n=1 Tax=Sesamum radiatum TaxID=300843 RepID=A0AAW2LPR5_SESRA
MMTSPSEFISFDCKPHIYSMLLKSFGDQTTEQTQKLEEFLARLEEERLKIDAFKRELPLCMQLLTNAVEASRQQLQSQRTNQAAGARPVLEEFIPLKNTTSSDPTENDGNNLCADKANWMTSAQLWNQESEEAKPPQSPLTTSPQETDIKLALNGKQRMNGGGAFHPFSSKDRVSSSSCGEAFPELALASSHKEEMEDKKNSSETSSRRDNSAGKCGNNSVADQKEQVSSGTPANTTTQTTERPGDVGRRTCTGVLSMLFTCWVVLKKYRLHTRRPSPSPQAPVTAPQVVVLGGIWVPPEYAAAAAHGGAPAAALYGAHAATTHHVSPANPFCSPGPPVPQEMYPAIAPPPPLRTTSCTTTPSTTSSSMCILSLHQHTETTPRNQMSAVGQVTLLRVLKMGSRRAAAGRLIAAVTTAEREGE